jgi:opacity protein-like surface antigen
MNSKDLAKKIASTVAMAGAVPLVAWCGLAMPAAGADFGQPFPGLPAPVPLDQNVGFASGWYVRGDLAYAAETFPQVSSAGTGDPTVRAMYPAFTFDPSSQVLNTYSAGAGLGYKVNNWFRTDLILDYRSNVHGDSTGPSITKPYCITGLGANPATPPVPPIIVTAYGDCTPNFNTDIHRWDLLANGYVDLGTWDGFTPYLGAGAGVAWARIKQSVTYTLDNTMPYQVTTDGFFFDYDSSVSNVKYQFAWALMAGVAIAMADHVQLDVGYRFLDLGNISGISTATGTPLSQRVLVNELRAGIRYTID